MYNYKKYKKAIDTSAIQDLAMRATQNYNVKIGLVNRLVVLFKEEPELREKIEQDVTFFSKLDYFPGKIDLLTIEEDLAKVSMHSPELADIQREAASGSLDRENIIQQTISLINNKDIREKIENIDNSFVRKLESWPGDVSSKKISVVLQKLLNQL